MKIILMKIHINNSINHNVENRYYVYRYYYILPIFSHLFITLGVGVAVR